MAKTPQQLIDLTTTLRKKMKLVLLLLSLIMLFKTVFSLIVPYYIKQGSETKAPIDTRVQQLEFFDDEYVKQAKIDYDATQYFKLFFQLDLVFPVVYSILFLTILSVFKNKEFWIYKNEKRYYTLRWLIIAGMAFDYLENFTFLLYLKSTFDLAWIVAFFTTIKTVLFAANAVFFIIGFFYTLYLFSTTQKDIGKKLT